MTTPLAPETVAYTNLNGETRYQPKVDTYKLYRTEHGKRWLPPSRAWNRTEALYKSERRALRVAARLCKRIARQDQKNAKTTWTETTK